MKKKIVLGYKHKFSIIRLELLWQRGYEDVFSSIPHKSPPLKRGTSKFDFFKQKLWVTSKKILNFVTNDSAKETMRMYFHLYHTNHPLGKEGPRNLNLFKQKLGVASTKCLRFVWNH